MADMKIAGIRLTVLGADEYTEALQEAARAAEINRIEQKKLVAQYGKGSKDAEYLAKNQKLLNEQLELQRKRTKLTKEIAEKYGQTQNANASHLHKLNVAVKQSEVRELDLERQLNQTTKALQESAQALDDIGKESEESSKKAQGMADKAEEAAGAIELVGTNADKSRARLKSFGENAIKLGHKLDRVGSHLSRKVTAPIIAGFGYAAKEAIDFEDAFQSVVKTVNADAKELNKLQRDIVDLSGSGIVRQSKEETAEVASIAGQLAIKTKNIVGFSKSVLQLEDATNLVRAQAAEQMAQIYNITGTAQEEFSNFGSALVHLGNTSAAQEDKILALTMRIGAAGSTVRMSIADILGISAAFASVGLEAEAGGTAISKTLLNIDIAVAKGGKAVKEYAKLAGVSAANFQKLWREDSTKGFVAIVEGLQKVEKSGGNVAIALERIGITDQRARDAMMRGVRAGELLASSIQRSNKAYRENTALTSEAAVKNSTFAARMRVVKNRIDNASMSLGQSLMPLLEKGLEDVDGLVKGFANLNEGQRKNIVQLGLVAAALGPVTKVAANFSKVLGFVGKGLGLLGSAAGPVGFAVAGFAALAIGVASAKSEAEQLKERLANIKFGFNAAQLDSLQEGLQEGIGAAQKEYSIKLGVEMEFYDLNSNLGGALEDRKLNRKERNGLKKQLNELVKKSVDEAKEDLEKSVQEYKQVLDGLKNINGEDLFSDSEKTALIEGVTEKTSALIKKLNSYQAEYDTLLDTIYKNKKPVTQQQMEELQALLDKIAGVRAEIKMANDEALQAAKAQYNLTVAGRGDAKTAGVALGYVRGVYDNKLAEIDAKTQRLLSNVEKSGMEEAEKIKAQEAIVRNNAEELQEASVEHAKGVARIVSGVAKTAPALAQKLKESAETIEKLRQLDSIWQKGKEEPEKVTLDDYKKIITPEIIAKYAAGTAWQGRSFNDIYAEALMSEGVGGLDTFLETLWLNMGRELESASEEMTLENPLTALLKTAMENGIEIDATLADGVLADLLKLLDFAGKGAEFGIDFAKGVGTGVKDGASLKTVEEAGKNIVQRASLGLKGLASLGGSGGGNLVDGFVGRILAGQSAAYNAGVALGDAAVRGLNSKGGIAAASPSKRTRQSGRWFVDGSILEVRAGMPEAQRVASEFGLGMVRALNGALKRPKMPLGMEVTSAFVLTPEVFYREGRSSEERGSVTTNIDDSASVYVEKMEVRKESDIQAISTEISNLNRRRRQGYGS